MGILVNFVPSYALDMCTLGLSINYKMSTEDTYAGKVVKKSNTSQMGFGLFVLKNVASGHLRTGFTYTQAETVGGKAYGKNTMSIPVILQYAFF